MRSRYLLLFLALFVFSPVLLWGQCTYEDLIKSNASHPNNIYCWPPDAEIKYNYSSYNEPFGSSSTEVDAAAASWNDNTNISLTSGSSGNMLWIANKTQWEYYGFDSTCAGVTLTSLTSDQKYISEFSIYINGAYFESDIWSSSCESGKIDLASIMRHEFGHAIGLGDVSCTNTVMDGTYTLGECRSDITAVDIEAANYLHDNSAGRLVDFRPIFEDGKVNVTWEIITHGEGVFYLERKITGEASFKKIAHFVFNKNNPKSSVQYKYSDNSGNQKAIYRLVERDGFGKRIVHAIEKPILPFNYNPNPPLTFNPDSIKADLVVWASKYLEKETLKSTSSTADWVAIGPEEYLSPQGLGISSLAYWHEMEDGISTQIRDLQYIESNWNGDLKAYISYLYENGTQYVVLVGDANDYELWDDPAVWDEIKPDYQSQPAYDIISADYYLDQASPDASMSYFTPYYASELPKSDIDDDGYPEMVIGRIPAHSATDVLLYTSKAVKYIQDANGPWIDEISLWIDSRNMAGNDGSFADSLGMDLLNYIPAAFNSHVIKNAPCPACLDYPERESMAIGEFDAGRSLIISFGTIANCYRLNDWLDVSNGFTVSKLDDNDIFPFLLATSCEQGAFDETESPNSGRPICERLLFDNKRGPIGIYAPSRGSWQTGNYLMGKMVLEYLYDKGAQSLGHACMAAQRDLMWMYPKYTDLAKSYVFLGDPALFLAGAVEGEITSIEEDPNEISGYALNAIYPNPFNPSTSIEFSLSKRGNVEVNVYDVEGKLVKSLFSGSKQAGTHTVRWNGTNTKGQSVVSGIYFCRLQLQGMKGVTRKMVLLR